MMTVVFRSATSSVDYYMHYTDDGGVTVKSIGFLDKQTNAINSRPVGIQLKGTLWLRPASVFPRALTAAEVDAYAPAILIPEIVETGKE